MLALLIQSPVAAPASGGCPHLAALERAAGKDEPSPDPPPELWMNITKNLGPLADLVGTWEGAKGFNLVSLPDDGVGFANITDPEYSEVITFCPIGIGNKKGEVVKNRGFKIPDNSSSGQMNEMTAGLTYNLQIRNKAGDLIHAENGMWETLNMPSGGYDRWQVARMSVIPHGNAVNAVGNVTSFDWCSTDELRQELEVQAERFRGFPNVAMCPSFGTPERPLPREGPSSGSDFDFLAKVRPLDSLHQANHDDGLYSHFRGDSLKDMKKLNVQTRNGYGAIGNQPFIRAQVDCTDFESNFYLQTLVGEEKPTRLQYMQRQTLSFNPREECKKPERYYTAAGHLDKYKLPQGYEDDEACIQTMPETLDELKASCAAAPNRDWPHIEVNTLTKREDPRRVPAACQQFTFPK